jgi:hypothetical protein
MARTIRLNDKAIVLAADEPTGQDVRHAGQVDPGRVLIDAQTRQIVRPQDRIAGDDLIDAPRFDKGR